MEVIIGSEAIASGALSRGQLRWNYVAVHPDVYVPKDQRRSLWTNAEAAWLWTNRTGIVAGRAAASLHGVPSIGVTTPIEMIGDRNRRRPGVIVRNERIAEDEVGALGSMRVTSAARTAFDLARRLPRDEAVSYLDQLSYASGVTFADVEPLVERRRGARGIQQARIALPLMDGGTRSPEETRLRLILYDAGLPHPRTSIVLRDGQDIAEIGMGWDDAKVGVSFLADAPIRGSLLVQEVGHQELVQRMGWLEIRVVALNQRMAIVHRVRRALRQRLLQRVASHGA